MAAPLRIVHVLRAPVGGLFRHVRDLAEEQSRRGHLVGAVCDAAASDALTEARLKELSESLALGLLRTPMSRDVSPKDLTGYRETRAFAGKVGADVLHGHGAKGGAFARLAARQAGGRDRAIAAIYTPHGGSLHYDPKSLKGRVYMAAERLLARATSAIVFESAFSAKAYAGQVKADVPFVRVIPNGLRPEEFAEHVPGADAADFLFIGELRRLKGVDVLLEALARVRTRQPVRAVIVGEGPDGDAFKKQAEALGLGPGVIHFAGALPARSAFPRGRCLLVPSRAESFPYIVLEAAAAGLPQLASDVGGIPEIVAGTPVRLLPPGDVDALAEAMRAFLADPAPMQAAAAALKSAVAARFTVAGMTDRILETYEAALALERSRAAAPDAERQVAPHRG